MINLFKMLSDETRLRILVLLYHQELCVCQLTGMMNESQPKISKHLAKLRDLGFVLDSRKEQFIYYRLNEENGLTLKIMDTIISYMDRYPKLKEDVNNLKHSDDYLTKCSK